MFRILVPVDGSETAERAVRHAAEIAKGRSDYEVQLLNVQDPVEEMQTHGLAKEAIREHREMLARKAAAGALAVLEKAGVRASFAWCFGDPAQMIARGAREEGCSMIVMGTRGAGALENLLIGSVAYKTLHLATVPVTLVK